jgi:tetratricopeptide (TPR) repeat protein
MLKDAIELHSQGRLVEAEPGYRDHLGAHPDDVDALHLLGLLRRQRGDAAEAERLVERARALAPDHAGILVSLGALRFQAGDLDGARSHYEQALAHDPNTAAAHAGLGQLDLLRGDAGEAERHFRTALRASEDAQSLAGLGALALDRGTLDEATRCLARAADLAPKDALIQWHLGRAFAASGTLAFAERAWVNALELKPDLIEARRRLAELLASAGRHADAEPHYRILAQSPGFAALGELGLGDFARADGRLDDAITHYRTALERDPDQAVALRLLGWSLVRQSRPDEAIAAYDAYLATHADDAGVASDRADLLVMLGRLLDATEAWQALHDDDPANPLPTLRLAVLREYLGQFGAAEDHAERALLLMPDEQEMLLVAARAALRNGDDAAARTTLERLGSVPTNPANARRRAQYLGFVHDRAGEREAAVACWRDAYRDAPNAMPPLVDPRSELDDALAEAPGEPWPQAPVLLLGLPGSGVERIAALLADQPELRVLRDRVGQAPRDDDFSRPRFAWYCGELDEAARAELRERYLAALGEAADGRILVDWLPRWDAHLLALLRRAMPGTRLVIVGSDAREALLDWLAFGFVPGFPCGDPMAAADWWLRGQRHLDHGSDLAEPRRLHVDADAVLADPIGAGTELARFLGLASLEPGLELERSRHGLGGLPTRFEPGYWHNYTTALAEPFGKLGPPDTAL